MFFPCLMLATSVGQYICLSHEMASRTSENVVLGVLFLIQLCTTNPYIGTGNVNFTMPYLGLSVALNIILTIAIVLRLSTFRRQAVSALGPKYGTPYTSIAAMTIESAALYSVVSIAFLVLFYIRNACSQALMQSLSQFQVRLVRNPDHYVLTSKIDSRDAINHVSRRAG